MIKYNSSLTVADIVKINRVKREKEKKNFEITKQNIEKIREHISTKIINYPEYEEAFDYVDELFPYSNAKLVTIFEASPRFLEKAGFGGIGGLYTKIHNTVIITKTPHKKPCKYTVSAKITRDEVMVHELLHYCYFEEGRNSNSTALKEEFAYGWSVNYLRQKGHSDDDIVKYNFLPYLYSIVKTEMFKKILIQQKIKIDEYNSFSMKKKERMFGRYVKSLHASSVKEATKKGHIIIDIYDRKRNNSSQDIEPEKINKFKLLDLD
jgi:hypothetical protein